MPSGIYVRTQIAKQNLSKALKGNTNGFQKGSIPTNYKGDTARYETKHQWVYHHYGKATKCENKECEYKNPKIYHWANLSGEYKRDIKDWIQLCPSCHKKMDWRPKETCRKGHLLSDVGILIDNRGSRICKECKRKNAQKDYAQHKESIIARVSARRKFMRSTIKR